MVVMFQTSSSGYPDSRLWPIFRVKYVGLLIAVLPPLPPPPRFPRPISMSSVTLLARASLSPPLAFSPPVFSFRCRPPPGAPVSPAVLRNCLAARCHAVPCVLPSAPIFWLAPPNLYGWRYLARGWWGA